MCRKLFLVISFVSLLAWAGNASAAEVTWDDGDPCDHLWSSPNNWDANGVPTSDDGLHLWGAAIAPPNGPVIETSDFEYSYMWSGGAAGDVEITMNSGTLSGNNFNMATAGDANVVLNMNGGHFIVGKSGNWNIGYQGGSGGVYGRGTVNMTGGKISCPSTMNVSYCSNWADQPSWGRVYLNGGEIHTVTLLICADGGPPENGKILIGDDGKLYINGDLRAGIQNYISGGYIVYGGIDPLAGILIDYPVDGNTVVSVYTPDVNIARNPSPADFSTVNIYDASTLTWTPGQNAAQHKVHFGTTSPPPEAPGQPQSPNNFSTTGLALGETYIWRIDEVNGATTWTGDEWTFTLYDYIVVEDFQSYNTSLDLTGVWSAGGGAVLALDVQGEAKRMELVFWNNYGTYKSSTTRTPPDPNLEKAGTKALYLSYWGDPNVTAVDVTLSDGTNTVTQTVTDTGVIQSTSVQELRFALADFSPVVTTNVTGELSGDCVINFTDFAILGGNWLKSGVWP